MGLFNFTTLEFEDFLTNQKSPMINLIPILQNFKTYGREPHDGFLTKGDHNQNIDQTSSLIDSDGSPIEPVKFEWFVGKAEGELPWFGLIRLYTIGVAGKEGKTPPATSANMLILSIVLIIIIISVIHMFFLRLERKRRRKRKTEREKKLVPYKKKI